MRNEDYNFNEAIIGEDAKKAIVLNENEKYEDAISIGYNNIHGILLYLELEEESKYTGDLVVEIYDKKGKKGLSQGRINLGRAKTGWNEIKLDFLLNVGEPLKTIKISTDDRKDIKIYLDENGKLCSKILYEKVTAKTQEEIKNLVNTNKYLTKELVKIHKSEGWKVLLVMYKIRDFIPNTLKKIANFLKTIFNIVKKINMTNIKKAFEYIKKYGFKALLIKLFRKDTLNNQYKEWLEKNKVTEEELEEQRKVKFQYEPKISVIVPTYNTPEHFLRDMIECVANQTYYNWELCVADASTTDKVKVVLEEYKAKYGDRLVIKYLTDNKGIAENTNEALALATGDFIGLFDHDDLLPLNSLYEIVKAINENPDADFIYTDEDKISEDGKRRFDPHFKTDWNPDLLRSHNYITHFSIFRKDVMEKIHGFRSGYNGSQDHDIILRATEVAQHIVHIPKILYHWRIHDKSTAANPRAKMYCYDSGVRAVKSQLEREGTDGQVIFGKNLGFYRTFYDIKGEPKVSIIIPNKDHKDDLKRCIKSIYKKTSYRNFEIVIVENNSTSDEIFKYYNDLEKEHRNLKVVKWEKEFNYSAINNFGVEHCTGEYILLLNNDTEVITERWIEEMLQHAQRKDIGVVGAKLYFDDDTVQHAGVLMNLAGVANHHFRGFDRKDIGYFSRLDVVQNYCAVTGACMMVSKELYDAVGGLDEQFVVAYNDIDFCLKVRELGKRNLFTPFAELYHYESKSRGYDSQDESKVKRLQKESDLFAKKWSKYLEGCDPYYNPNFSNKTLNFDLNI